MFVYNFIYHGSPPKKCHLRIVSIWKFEYVFNFKYVFDYHIWFSLASDYPPLTIKIDDQKHGMNQPPHEFCQDANLQSTKP